MDQEHQEYLERLRQRARDAIEAHVNEQFNHGMAPVFDWDLYLTEDGSEDPFVDLLTDLWHLAEHYNLDMEFLVETARDIYRRESKGDTET